MKRVAKRSSVVMLVVVLGIVSASALALGQSD
jgi:hypothetical protein